MKITLNKELNGIELSFESKPDAKTLEAVKRNGFRWSPKNKLWYAKQTAERLTFIESLDTVMESAPTACSSPVINLEGLSNADCLNARLFGADLAKAIREDLKKRGATGCTVRAGKATYTTTIRITVKATAEDFASLEEAKERYTFSQFSCDIECNNGLYIGDRWLYIAEFSTMCEEEKEQAYYSYLDYTIRKLDSFSGGYTWSNRAHYWELTTAFYEKLSAIYKIANQWNYNNSDIMSDYFDVGYYLDIDIKKAEDFAPRATMTEEERTEYAEEVRKEEEERERQLQEWKEEQARAKEEAEKYNNWVKESEELIYNNIYVEDLEEAKQLFVVDLVGGIGKESDLEELQKEAKENPHKQNALVTRVIKFTDSEVFNRFCKLFLHDFAFISGMGGTASEDVRFSSFDDYFKMNEAQRETIELYSCNCIAIYFNDCLKFVIDPQGATYARYVYLADNCTIYKAAPKLEEQRKASEEKEPFYFPAPIEEQINNISVGDDITVWQCDGWILNKVLDGFGTVTAINPGSYAQYEGIYIDLQQGRKQKRVFIRNNHECLIYKGLNVLLPDEVTRRKISDTMSELYNYDVLMPNIYNYFKAQGIEPILDTWQR